MTFVCTPNSPFCCVDYSKPNISPIIGTEFTRNDLVIKNMFLFVSLDQNRLYACISDVPHIKSTTPCLTIVV